MTWTYSGDPSANTRDEVRFLIGDTDTTDQQITDEEIAYLIAEYTNPIQAAAQAVKALAAKFARLVDKSVGDLKISYSQRAKQYWDLAKSLESRAADQATGVVVATGTKESDKDTQTLDDDRVDPSFVKDQFDHYGSKVEPDTKRRL